MASTVVRPSFVMPPGDLPEPFYQLRPRSLQRGHDPVEDHKGSFRNSRTIVPTDSQGPPVLLCSDRDPERQEDSRLRGFRDPRSNYGRIFKTLHDGEVFVVSLSGASVRQLLKLVGNHIEEAYGISRRDDDNARKWPPRPSGVSKKRLVLVAGTNDLSDYLKRGATGSAARVVERVMDAIHGHQRSIEEWCDEVFLVRLPFYERDNRFHNPVPEYNRHLRECDHAVREVNSELDRFCYKNSSSRRTIWRTVRVPVDDVTMRADGLHWEYSPTMYRAFFTALADAMTWAVEERQRAADDYLHQNRHAIGVLTATLDTYESRGAARERRCQEEMGVSARHIKQYTERHVQESTCRLSKLEGQVKQGLKAMEKIEKEYVLVKRAQQEKEAKKARNRARNVIVHKKRSVKRRDERAADKKLYKAVQLARRWLKPNGSLDRYLRSRHRVELMSFWLSL
ncbi:uncharacterized protein LOC129601241 [Paramacrobiotus metropolitanus]|uniref:uncharacterized protein LOC129601241 n=1 Tax=Paramacrobiotus metropolitanus TaxID=2943436 RepID=UPI0024463E47|nr:uncharacterized protein LOC129601241 [Paramacrobiotus metropolitanus]XP_055355972.1 uncharacterized protein LOC129601241 [Paramacrobiotus metropolitanus]XP_055355973.1 uncharacterized protein LOC129601241 [Paramacrobiotus metropolitanus]